MNGYGSKKDYLKYLHSPKLSWFTSLKKRGKASSSSEKRKEKSDKKSIFKGVVNLDLRLSLLCRLVVKQRIESLESSLAVIQKNKGKKPRVSQSYKNLFNISDHLVYNIQLGLKSLKHL